MSGPFNVALIQTTSGRNPDDNVRAITPMIEDAAGAGADLIMLPETVSMMESDAAQLRAKARNESYTTALAAFAETVRSLKVWLMAGSMVIAPETGSSNASGDSAALANRSFLVGPDGEIRARYDKVHMFDVELASGERYRESANYRPGDRLVVAETPWGGLGMTVCYDLRFPHLYRALAQAGARYFSIPSAFTRPTGKAHWEVLLRARAIENGCFVFAPAQCGKHESGRETHGHSMIVDPWGQVLADGGESPGIVSATIDPARVASARKQVPSLNHDRPFS
ncbi:MAG: carbon-nitrogen hydrolase family protein [Rhodospirillales bacterium]